MVYLTVQDILWIHFQITKENCAYNYASLEAATYAQYGYGKSIDIFEQACQFYNQIILKVPFTKENELLALMATKCFLGINGYCSKDEKFLSNFLSQKDISKLKTIFYQNQKKNIQECMIHN